MTSTDTREEPPKTTLLVLFVPSHDRDGNEREDQEAWVKMTLAVLGRLFGGATAFPKGLGVWRDDERGGALIYDSPVIVHCYTTVELIEQEVEAFKDHLTQMGRETRQGAVGYVIDDRYYEIRFPLG